MDTDSTQFELDDLTGLFFSDLSELGDFTQISSDQMVEPYPSLLDHDFHMTVTLEKFHSSAVDVDVLQTQVCLLYTSPSPRDATLSRMPSSA